MKVLFVGYGGGHVAMLLPVMRALRARHPGAQLTLLALTTAYKAALAAGEQPLGYRDFLHLFDADAARAWGERLLEGNGSPDVTREESLAYLGLNYLDLVAQHGKEGAAERFARLGRHGFRPLHFMRRVFDELQPDVVVATSSPRSEAAALEVATERGIPSVGMIDLFALEGEDYLNRGFRPQWTCVLAQSVRERVIARGFPPERVLATGNPAFDGLQSEANRAAADRFLAQLGWHGLSPILWAGQSEPAAQLPPGADRFAFAQEVEGSLRALVDGRPELALIVRYHPGEWQLFARIADTPRIHFSVPLEELIHPLVLAASAVVVQNSTVGLEAAIAGKPVVSMEASLSVRSTFSLATLGVSTPCQSNEQLAILLPQLLASRAPGAGGYTSDGQAAERVATVIERALGATRP